MIICTPFKGRCLKVQIELGQIDDCWRQGLTQKSTTPYLRDVNKEKWTGKMNHLEMKALEVVPLDFYNIL